MTESAVLSSAGGWWALIERRAASAPESCLLADTHGRRLTSSEYRETAEAIAAGLFEQGVRPGMTVSWQLPTTTEAALLMSALARLGVTQNPLMPVLRDAEIGPMLEQLRPDFLIVPVTFRGYDHADLGRRLTAAHGGMLLAVDLDQDSALPRGDRSVLVELPPSDPGTGTRWVFFTSGTTGKPKGVKHTDDSVLHGSDAALAQLGFTSADVLSIVFPITHIGGPGIFATALRAGASVVLADVFDAARTPFELAAAGVTMLGSAAPFFEAYLAAQHRHGPQRLFPRLRLVMNGGAPPSPGMHERVVRELGGRGVFNGYGLTEVPMISYAPFDADPDFVASGAVIPTEGVDMRVVAAGERVAADGEEGEIRLRGPQLTSGYVDSAQEIGAFDAEGFFKTGDLGVRSSDGSFRVTGRLKDIIIRNAENISALEIENVLSDHPAIAEVSVIGLPDARTGERCCAVIIPVAPDRSIELAELAGFCRERGLAPFKIPEQLELVSELPRNPMGKVVKADLRRTIAGRAGEWATPSA